MGENALTLEVFLRLLGVYGICLAAGFAFKAAARGVHGAGAPAPRKGPGIGRKFKVFFAFQSLLFTVSFWWLPGLGLYLLALVSASAWEIASLRRSSPSRPGYPFRAPEAYGLLALFAISSLAFLLSAPGLAGSAAAPGHAGMFSYPRGLPFLAFLFLLVAVFDGFSQICGEILGGPRLVPGISPGKTWSGFIGGMAFCMAVAAWGQAAIHPFTTPVAGAALGAAVGMLALLGDLSASFVKRRLGVKDFSNLLGPQGGVLDRADSLLWLGPALWAYSRLTAGFPRIPLF